VLSVFISILSIYGVATGGPMLGHGLDRYFYAGAYAAMFVAVLYTGRYYYWQSLRGSLGLSTREAPDRRAVWSIRVFIGSILVFIALLVIVGLDWQLAVLYTIGLVMIFTVISRIVAETGAFFIHAWFFPCGVIIQFLGARNIGPEPAIIMMLVSTLLLIDPRESLMPFVAHGLKIADRQKLPLGAVARGSVLAVIVAFACAVPATLYWTYNEGVFVASDGWTQTVPRFAFDQAMAIQRTLESQDVLADTQALHGFARFLHPAPNVPAVLTFLLFFGLTLGCWWARLRLAWWPIHPVLFCVLGTFQCRMLAASFLIGCLVKFGVTRYGGSRAFNQIKPLLIGLVAGEMLGGLLPMIYSLAYYLITGDRPPSFQVFRG
jgi:hypothetical protein